MRVLHVISCMVRADGHSQFCMTLAERMAAQGMEHRIFAMPSENGEALPDPKQVIHYATGRALGALNVRLQLGLERQIKAIVREFKPDVVHLHGGWHPVLFFGARAAKQLGVRVLLSLHGSLRPAVIEGDRRLKKRLAWWLYQRRLVGMADMIHVSTEDERTDVIRLGFEKPVVVVPNAVNDEDFVDCAAKGASAQRWPECGGKRVVLFLSRIHPLKGLDALVSAWARIATEFPDWHVLIAGPDESGYEAKLRRLVQQAGLGARVTCCGPLYGADKASAMQSAGLFVLPTHSENFGIVVAEALACGVPVITTKGAPWQELLGSPASSKVLKCESSKVEGDGAVGNTQSATGSGSTNELMNSRTHELPPDSSFAAAGRSGWWIDVGVEPLVEALREAMTLTDEERRAMGENGRRLVEAKYQWPMVAKAMEKVYGKCVNAGLR